MDVPSLCLDAPQALTEDPRVHEVTLYSSVLEKQIIETVFAEIPGLRAHDLCGAAINLNPALLQRIHCS